MKKTLKNPKVKPGDRVIWGAGNTREVVEVVKVEPKQSGSVHVDIRRAIDGKLVFLSSDTYLSHFDPDNPPAGVMGLYPKQS